MQTFPASKYQKCIPLSFQSVLHTLQNEPFSHFQAADCSASLKRSAFERIREQTALRLDVELLLRAWF